MEETRRYPLDEDESWYVKDEERGLETAPVQQEEVPFHIPRD